MTYQEQLTPWTVQQQLPNLNQKILARFRRQGEANAYAETLKQMRPGAKISVAFSMESVDGIAVSQ